MIDDVRAADPYPPSRVALDLDAEGRELMEEIMSTTKEKTPLRAHPLRRHGRWVVPVAAAAAVAAVVAGGVVLRGGDDGADRPDNQGPANPGQAKSSKSTQQKPAQPKQRKSDPGLPPTAENLHHVVLNDEAWQISNLTNDEAYGGSLSWSKGKRTLQVTWYRAADYQAYLADRRDIGPARDVTVLGQQGEAFHQPIDLQKSGDQSLYLGEPTLGPGDEDPGNNLRVTTILPPVGGFFLEFDAFMTDEAEYGATMAALSRVNGQAWTAAIDRATVTAGEGQAFLDQAGQGVPLPPGMTVTVADLELPQSAYHARASYVSKVLCGWAERYVGGDDAALDALQGSADWAVLQAMVDGGYPEATEEIVQDLAADRTFDGWRQGWGCA